MDASSMSAIFVSLATLLTWLAAQARSQTHTLRREVRRLRAADLAKDRYIYRLEHMLAARDLPFPDRPAGLDAPVIETGEEP